MGGEDGEEEEEEEDENKETEKVEVTAKKRPNASAAKATGPAKRSRPSAQGNVVDVQPKILQDAEKLGFVAQIKNLAARPELQSGAVSQKDMLEALKASGGLVNKAKAALLGA